MINFSRVRPTPRHSKSPKK